MRKTNTYVFDTMKQCSAALQIPLSILKSAKRCGCPAFKAGGRVAAPELLGWFFDREDADGEGANWVKMFEEFRAKREKIRHDKEAGHMIDKPFVKQENQKALAMLFGEIDRTFCTQLPPDLKGRTEGEIRRRCVEAVEAMKARLKKEFERAAQSTPEE